MSRVLVVDDDPAVGRLMGIVLRSAGHQARKAEDLREANRLLLDWEPEVVLLDLRLGTDDGRDLFRTAREQGSKAAFIVVSAYEAKRVSSELGAEAWLEKPFEMEVLLTMVQEFAAGSDGVKPRTED